MVQGGAQVIAEESSPVIGLLWNAPKVGETAIVRPVGNGCWPFTAEGPARANLSLIMEAARTLGYQVPERFLCYAGQLFYRLRRLEEVRLLGGVLGDWDAQGRTTLTYWSTPTEPTVTMGPDGEPRLDATDANRTHLSAIVVEAQEIEGCLAVAFLWDLRANLPAHNLPEIEPAAPLLPRHERGHLFVLSPAHYHALREALPKKTFHRHEGTPWPTARLDRRDAHGYAQIRPAALDDHLVLPPEEVDAWAARMWRQREELSDLDADVLDALCAIWLAQARSADDSAIVDVDGLLAMRGLKRKRSGPGRRGGYELEQRLAILRALSRIQNLWLDMMAGEAYDDAKGGRRRRTPRTFAVQSRAFVMTDRMGQLRLDGRMDVQRFIFRPGAVFARFLTGPGRQIALLSARALHYDPLKQWWEKRLARYLSWQWRIRGRRGDYLQPYRIRTLLEAVGKLMKFRRASRVRTRLESALDTLQCDGVIAAWQYSRWEEPPATSRDWAHNWLQATILIEPPAIIQEHYQQLNPRNAPPRAVMQGLASLADRIKLRRQALGLTLVQAAEQIGISPSDFDWLERGQRGRPHSPDLQRKVQRWLATEENDGR